MTIKVKLFASLREDLGCDQVEVQLPTGARLPDLITHLAQMHDQSWREKLSVENVRVAVNQELVSDDHAITDGDEVAFFPPVTGG